MSLISGTGQRTSRCRHCGEERENTAADSRPPPGWLSLSVTVPEGVTTAKNRPFIWVGLYCQVACLVADGDRLAASERLAGWREQAS